MPQFHRLFEFIENQVITAVHLLFPYFMGFLFPYS